MRALPGLLIEYLITGTVALFWLSKLIAPTNFQNDPVLTLLLIPSAYVLGMVIDLLAFILFLIPKYRIRNEIDNLYKVSKRVSRVTRRVFIIKESPELAEELEKWSSRDRIARGFFINLLAICSVYQVSYLATILLLVFVFGMWWRFEYESYKLTTVTAKLLNYDERDLL